MIVGIMPVRNEDWILGFSLRVALEWCDFVICCDHGSTDYSHEIMRDVAKETDGRVLIQNVDSETWHEMAMRQRLLVDAREIGAKYVALVDADEVVTANVLTIARQFRPGPRSMLELPGYNLRQSPYPLELRYHSNGVWGNRWFSTTFTDDPAAHWSGDRFHHREPMGVTWGKARPLQQHDGGVLHFWGASEKRLIAKHALYKVVERIRWPDRPIAQIEQLYNLAIRPTIAWSYKSVPEVWLAGYEGLMKKYYRPELEPWQTFEVQRLIREHGADKFKGLDLFGVDTW